LLKGQFIDAARGRLFCAVRLPDGRARSAVMVVPAFGDEMNKSRRMVTETAKKLNAAGVAVVVPDLFGTGDSEGSFADADWETWTSDLKAVLEWAVSEGMTIRWLVAIRTGALLAAQFAKSYAPTGIEGTVFWQPVVLGSAFVRQTLRVRTLASAVQAGTRETVDELIARIQSGETIFAGGYPLTRTVIDPLIGADLGELMADKLGALHSVEVTRIQDKCGSYDELLGGRRLRGVRFLGEPYWSAAEIICDMNVVARTAGLIPGVTGTCS
jgi:exosortase A-associated hydrolase 2